MAKTKRKPVEKPKQFCISVKNSDDLEKDRKVIEDAVISLYSNKRWKNPVDPELLSVILDVPGKRVCIELTKKINANYILLEDVHNKLKSKYLKVKGTSIVLGKPHAEVMKHHLEQEKQKVKKGDYWATLSHNGPYFGWIQEPYKPHKAPILYNGKAYKLTPKEEEVANFWAKRQITDETATVSWTTDPVFRKNFFKDFKTYLTKEHRKVFKDFSKLDFSKIRKKILKIKESTTPAQKREKKKYAAEKKYKYGFAKVNGVIEAVSNYNIEPASLFVGRGKNKIRGRIKRHVTPEEVTINIGKEAKVPKPPKGYKWKAVVHDKKARWLMKWNDTLTNSGKYVYMSAEGQFKSASDASKFEKARKLQRYLEKVRRGYTKDINSKNETKRQLGTVLYLIDHYGIRVGGANDEKTADTFGASTLEVGHAEMISPDKVRLNFLGKDSIAFDKTMKLSPQVYKNVKSFLKNKKKKEKMFDLITSTDINLYLKKYDKDLTAKVFRTRIGSHTMYEELKKIKFKKNENMKLKAFDFMKANVRVAKLLNHQKSVAKKSDKVTEKYEKQLRDWKKELKKKKGGKTASLEKRIRDKKMAIEKRKQTKNVAVGTSLQNYIDPRIVVSWAERNDVDINKLYTPTLRRKFKWAIDDTKSSWDYDTSPLSKGYEKLSPFSGEKLEEMKKKRGKRTPKKKVVVEVSSSSSDSDEPIWMKGKVKKTPKARTKKKKVVVEVSSSSSSGDDSSSSSDSDEPILIKRKGKRTPKKKVVVEVSSSSSDSDEPILMKPKVRGYFYDKGHKTIFKKGSLKQKYLDKVDEEKRRTMKDPENDQDSLYEYYEILKSLALPLQGDPDVWRDKKDVILLTDNDNLKNLSDTANHLIKDNHKEKGLHLILVWCKRLKTYNRKLPKIWRKKLGDIAKNI